MIRPLLISLVLVVAATLFAAFSEERAFLKKGKLLSASVADQHSSPVGSQTQTQSNVLYGHVHIAKTAGTTLNGELAMHFERVCGQKGYSFDAISTNERAKKAQPHSYLWR